MARNHVDHSRDSSLRLVFDDTVESFSVTAGATYGDIAAILGELTNRNRGNLNAIDVTLNLPFSESLPFSELFDPRRKERVMLRAAPSVAQPAAPAQPDKKPATAAPATHRPDKKPAGAAPK